MKPEVKKRIVLFIMLFCGIMIYTLSICGCQWASPPPETKFQTLEELKISLADENMWFFDLDFGINETDFQNEDYISRVEKVSGGGCTETKETFNHYYVGKTLRKGDDYRDAYLKVIIRGYTSEGDKSISEEYNFDGIPGMMTQCYIQNWINEEGFGDYKCKFEFHFRINEKNYYISIEQETWKSWEDRTQAEDSIFGKIISKEVFLELVETAIMNRFQ